MTVSRRLWPRRAGLGLWLLLAVAPLAARARPKLTRVIPKNLTVLPHRVIPSSGRRIFAIPGDLHPAPEPAVAPAGQFDVVVSDLLDAQPELVASPWTEVRSKLDGDPRLREATRLTRAAVQLGIQQYRNLLVKEARITLQNAERLARDSLLGLREPALAGDLYLYLGLSYLEDGREDDARAAFRRLFFHQPARSFQKGFFPAVVEQALRSAYADFVREPFLNQPTVERTTLPSLHARSDQDLAVTLVTSLDEPGALRVAIYDLRRGVPVQEGRIPLTRDGEPDADQLDRLMGRFLACQVFERAAPVRPGPDPRRYFIEADFGYHTYFEHPTRSLFHSIAVGVAVGKGLSRNVGLFGRIMVLSSVEDRNRDLSERLVSVRATFGPEFKLRLGPVTLYFAPGVDLAYLPSYRVLTSPECKLFGTDHERCRPDNVKNVGSQFLAGFTGSLGARFNLTEDFFLGLQAGAGLYLLPTGRSDTVDLPFGAHLALGFHL